MAAFGRGPIWPDILGTLGTPTEALVVSTRELEIREEGALACRLVITGAACRAVVLEGQESTDGQVWRTTTRKTILGATIGIHQAVLRFTMPCLARVLARRYGIDPDTRLVVTADARNELGDRFIDSQPLELAGHQPVGVECWGDGVGGAVAMAAGPAAHVPAPAPAADQQWLPTGEADTLVVDWTVAVAAPVTVELEVRERAVGSAIEVEQPAVNNVIAGVIAQQIAQEQLVFGAIDVRRSREIAVRPNTEVLLLAQYTGGGGGTTGLGVARFYRLGRG